MNKIQSPVEAGNPEKRGEYPKIVVKS